MDIGQIDANLRTHWNDESMLRGIAKFVDCKEQVVRTSVRLETAKKPRDFFGESLATTTYATFEVSSGFTEGEVDSAEIVRREFQNATDGNGSHFEGCSQVFNDMNCMFCKADWEGFAESKLVPFVNAVRIRVDDMSAWCSLEINPSAPFKVGKAFLCPLESQS